MAADPLIIAKGGFKIAKEFFQPVQIRKTKRIAKKEPEKILCAVTQNE